MPLNVNQIEEVIKIYKEKGPGTNQAVMGAGAYGFSMSSNYNSRRRAQEIMVVKDKVFVIRKREAYQDLTHNEIIPGFLSGNTK